MTRILVVEDEPDIALGLRDDLTRQGYDVETVGDGDTAIHRASANTVHLVFPDAYPHTPDTRA